MALKYQILFILFANILLISCKAPHFTYKKSEKMISFSLTRKEFYDTSLENIENVEYQTVIYAGSPAQASNVIIDTGSADLYLPSTENDYCVEIVEEEGSDESYTLFNCSASRTCTSTTESILIGYDDGDVFTNIVWDRISLGSNLVVSNQSFLLAYEMIGNFDCYGLWGLGPPLLAENPNRGFLENLYYHKKIAHYLFGLFLTDDTSGEESKLIIGGIDDSLLSSSEDLVYFPFLTKSSYHIEFDSLMLNDEKIDLENINTALPDSGNSELTIPSKIAIKIRDYLNSDFNMTCYYEVESSATDYSMLSCLLSLESKKFPNISLGLKGVNITLQPEDYLDECELLNNGSLLCSTNLESSNADDEIILGDAFLRNFYSIFDLENWKLGLGKSKTNSTIKLTQSSKKMILDEEVVTVNALETRNYGWKVYLTISGFLIILPLIYLSGFILNRRKIIDDDQTSKFLGLGFFVVIIGINFFISII